MLRCLFGLLFLASCSMGVISQGGEKSYVYDSDKDYTPDQLGKMSNAVIMSSRRNPPDADVKVIFNKGKFPIKKIGIVIFESEIQPTRSGLAGEDLVYLSESGKQIFTERLARIWDEILSLEDTDIEYLSLSKIKQSMAFSKFGVDVVDHVKASRSTVEPDDIFIRKKGQKTTLVTTLNPRGMRDLSLLLVPATELMGGPKWSEHQKHFVNELSKEFGLDAVLIVFSQLSWTKQRIDKHSGEYFGDNLSLKLSSSVLIPLSKYRDRAIEVGVREPHSVNICFKSYSTSFSQPLNFDLQTGDDTFFQIQTHLMSPLFKTYRDLTFMMVSKIKDDLRDTL